MGCGDWGITRCIVDISLFCFSRLKIVSCMTFIIQQRKDIKNTLYARGIRKKLAHA